MGSLPMNFYFQKMDIAKLEVSLQLTEVEGGVFLLSPPPCRASPLRVRVRAGRADWQEVNIFQNFCVSRKLKFDYLDSQH